MNPQPDDKPTSLIPANIYPAGNTQQTQPRQAGPAPAGAPAARAPQANVKAGGRWRSTLPTILLFLLAPATALFIAAFVIQSYQVDGESMETTLQNNNRLIVDKIPRTLARLTHHDYIPARGNIVIFNQSGLPDSGPTGQKQLIKRVIGLPGDRVVVQNGFITIYNKSHPNGFNPDQTTGYHISATFTPGNVDVTLGPTQIFVCGDNRGNSEDSRYFGPVDASQLVGKLILRILPDNEIKKF